MFTIACLTVLLQNCGPELDCGNSDKVTDYKIDADDLNKIPYTGFETLTFVRTTQGDTHTFVGNGWKQDWGLTTTREDCPQKERYERRQLTFTSPSFAKPIIVSIYRHDITKSTFLSISFQNTSFYDASVTVGKPYDIDSINILGTNYVGINFLSDLDSTTPVTYKCYYNAQYGILRLFFDNGETWDLLKQ